MTYSGRFMTIIKKACQQTGRRVVVLIDEYDKPMLRSFDNSKLQDDFHETLTAFYIGKFVNELESGNAEAFLCRLRAFFADFPYELNAKTERH